MDNQEELAISRFFQRFTFGPNPGEYQAGLNLGYNNLINNHLNKINIDGGTIVSNPALSDLGPFPLPKSPNRAAFSTAMQNQRQALLFWWLDRAVLTTTPMLERMVWFWHGHWATSIGKVEYALPMYLQNQTFRQTAFGNFQTQVNLMMQDPALLYWLDAGANLKQSPNENLARELMELFTLGVNNYTQNDVTQVARALTGWNVNRHAATVSYNARAHDNSNLNILGNSGSFDAPAIAKLLVAQNNCQNFIPNRLWFRFISSVNPIDPKVVEAFANRDILNTFSVLLNSSGMRDNSNSLVKSPVEWFIGACKALQITPSKLTNPGQVSNYLNSMGQLPFDPPNVGGWPHDTAWLSAAATQYRISFTNYLITRGVLPTLSSNLDTATQLSNWLGIYQFSPTTIQAINSSKDLKTAVMLALISPENVVSV